MTNFELIQDLIIRVKEVESDLLYLKDTSEPLTTDAIEKTILIIKELYDNLMTVDKALEDEKMGYVLF